ncbi:Hypothetical predicted protein [Xyrichtys novacula]|uniref:Uncharacterized protein n=1 Tax=Xyrichtys novacula TaxID=13765 RepID=A0AAV1GZH1_XYRNO|nr:Hypothetical predicted protein [Xyrichtys novacula]
MEESIQDLEPESTQTESTADPKQGVHRAKPGAALPDKQKRGAGLQRAACSVRRTSALLHDLSSHTQKVLFFGCCTVSLFGLVLNSLHTSFSLSQTQLNLAEQRPGVYSSSFSITLTI